MNEDRLSATTINPSKFQFEIPGDSDGYLPKTEHLHFSCTGGIGIRIKKEISDKYNRNIYGL